MPFVDHARREIRLKLVYYGPGLGGKTTNVESIYRRTRPSHRGKLVALTTEAERTLFFDLLPVEFGHYKGYRVRCHLCTVPGQLAQVAVRRIVLSQADGIVFVVDSQHARLSDNVASMADLRANLTRQGEDPDRIPLVVQYNKRDIAGALPEAALARSLGIGTSVPQVTASATTGEGVFETLRAALSVSLDVVRDPAAAPNGRVAPVVARKRKARVSKLRTGAGLPGQRGLTGARSSLAVPPPARTGTGRG